MKIELAGQSVELTPDGAVWLPDDKALAIADLHFEKGTFFSRFATFLPPYDSGDTLKRLGTLIERYRPQIFIAAGDSFHDAGAVSRMKTVDLAHLNDLIGTVPRWYWLAGNHDPKVPEKILGAWQQEFYFPHIAFRHQLTDIGGAEISGHYHPKVRLSLNGHRLSMPCFVHKHDRLIMPSFGQFTGGLDVNSIDFLNIAAAGTRQIYAIHQDRVFRI